MAERIVDEVCQYLAHEDMVHIHQGQIGGACQRMSPAAPAPPEHQERLVYQVGHRCRLAPELEGAGLYPRHVQQVGHEAVEAVGLRVDELGELFQVARAERGTVFEQRRCRDLYRRERRAQVMRHRAHQRPHGAGRPPPTNARTDGVVAEPGPLQGKGKVVGESSQELLCSSLELGAPRSAIRPTASSVATRATT